MPEMGLARRHCQRLVGCREGLQHSSSRTTHRAYGPARLATAALLSLLPAGALRLRLRRSALFLGRLGAP